MYWHHFYVTSLVYCSAYTDGPNSQGNSNLDSVILVAVITVLLVFGGIILIVLLKFCRNVQVYVSLSAVLVHFAPHGFTLVSFHCLAMQSGVQDIFV